MTSEPGPNCRKTNNEINAEHLERSGMVRGSTDELTGLGRLPEDPGPLLRPADPKDSSVLEIGCGSASS